MAFVHLGGDDSNRPTYFEVLAADKLVPSLKAALVYALSVFSQRHPWLHRVLDHEEEVLAVAVLAADWHSLRTSDATFAESLYGLRRRLIGFACLSETAAQQQAALPGVSRNPAAAPHLTAQQRWLSLLVEIGLPYIRAKAERALKQSATAGGLGGGGGPPAFGGVLGLAARRGVALSAATPFASTWVGQELAPRLRHALAKGLAAMYPLVHSASEAVCLGYQVAYLLNAAPSHRALLHAQRLQLARVSAQDLAEARRRRDVARRAALSSTWLHPGRPRWLVALHQLLLHLSHLASDHAHHALMLLVFGFKALEWWFTSAEERLAAGKALTPPPPPPPPRPSPLGVGVPADPGSCAVCRQQLTNPAQVSTSGYVFCYRCCHLYVSEHRCCPVTRVPCSVDHVRKLYDSDSS